MLAQVVSESLAREPGGEGEEKSLKAHTESEPNWVLIFQLSKASGIEDLYIYTYCYTSECDQGIVISMIEGRGRRGDTYETSR